MAPRGIEVEWQFVVRDLDAFRRSLARARIGAWAIEPRGVLRLRDGYFDTADWRVFASGYALRVRRADAVVEATLKAVGRARRGLARRREISSPLPDARVSSLLATRARVGAMVRKAADGTRLRRLFGLRTRREVFAVRYEGRTVAELVLDRTRIVAGGRERRLARVEVEVTSGSSALVARFVVTLRRGRHLTAAKQSKFEAGLATARLRPARRAARR